MKKFLVSFASVSLFAACAGHPAVREVARAREKQVDVGNSGVESDFKFLTVKPLKVSAPACAFTVQVVGGQGTEPGDHPDFAWIEVPFDAKGSTYLVHRKVDGISDRDRFYRVDVAYMAQTSVATPIEMNSGKVEPVDLATVCWGDEKKVPQAGVLTLAVWESTTPAGDHGEKDPAKLEYRFVRRESLPRAYRPIPFSTEVGSVEFSGRCGGYVSTCPNAR